MFGSESERGSYSRPETRVAYLAYLFIDPFTVEPQSRFGTNYFELDWFVPTMGVQS